MKKFSVVIAQDDGGSVSYPMKEWLRQHAEHVPSGLDATLSTSHQLRNGLKRLGWLVQDSATETKLIMPGTTLEQVHLDNSPEDDSELELSNETSFGLEYQLRDFLAQNISAIPINGRRVKLYVDPTGRDGIEFPTAVGPVDILGVDEDGSFVVFELKRANSSDRAIGQLARYIGWVKQTIGKGKDVRGVIVAGNISDNLRYAATVIPNVTLFEYEVSFKLNPVLPMQNA